MKVISCDLGDRNAKQKTELGIMNTWFEILFS